MLSGRMPTHARDLLSLTPWAYALLLMFGLFYQSLHFDRLKSHILVSPTNFLL